MRLLVRIVLIGRDRSRHGFDRARLAKNSVRFERPPLRLLWVARVSIFTALEVVHTVNSHGAAPPLGVKLRFAGFQRVAGATFVAPVLMGTKSALWKLSAQVLLR